MKTRTCSLLALALWLLVFGMPNAIRAQGSDKAEVLGRPNSDLVQRIMSGLDEDVRAEFEKAWQVAGSGCKPVEGVVLLFRNKDGSIMARSQGWTNERLRFTFKWSPTIIAVVHTHPNTSNPQPEGKDLELADRFRIPIFTITNRGMFAYDPTTRKTTKVAVGLTCMETSGESRDSRDPAKP